MSRGFWDFFSTPQFCRSARRNWRAQLPRDFPDESLEPANAGTGTVPAHLVADVAAGTALTIFNPSTMVYWIGVASNWLPFANSIFGSKAPGWRILMAAAGLMTWFTTLIVVVQFIPHRIGPTFFRLGNAILGLILLGFATFCTMVPSRHFLH